MLPTTSFTQTSRFAILKIVELYNVTNSNTTEYKVDLGASDHLINQEDLAKNII